MNKKLLIFFSIILGASSYRGQDFHISQYDVATLYLNPALTGVYGREGGDYRVYALQRSQWRSIGIKPFMTSYLAYDMPYKIKDKTIGLGGYIINNNGGFGNFNTITFMPSASYNILNAKSNDEHLLTVGLQMGLFYRSTDPNSLNYDVQYSMSNNGGSFDKGIANDEAYNRVNITRFDANYGLFYRYIERGKKAHPFVGLSMSHLTRPNESMTGAYSRLPIKWAAHGGCDIKLDDKMKLVPRIFFLTQGKAYDFTSGFLFYYKINENGTKLFTGFDYRWKDACLLNLGLKHESYALRFSYDINTSYLKNYSNGRGAFEISLIYIGEKGKPFFQAISQF
jgi:type IX secretion system PorP/SprF family membrane protein